MKDATLLEKAKKTRETEHRLTPNLRLKTLDEVKGFIHNRGLVSTLGGNELPSLISAVLGKPWKATGKGFTSWLDWWNLQISGQPAGRALMTLDRMQDILGTRIFRNSKTLLSKKLWPIVDPIVEHYLELAMKHKILSNLEWKILDALEEKGPTRTDRLRTQLKLEGKIFTSKFHRSLSLLESYGLIVGYEDPKPERHLHANIWQLWKNRVGPALRRAGRLSYEEALVQLLERTIDVCVLSPEKEIGKWFRWNGTLIEAKERLLRERRIVEVGSFLIPERISNSEKAVLGQSD